jgi:hypothetical protein
MNLSASNKHCYVPTDLFQRSGGAYRGMVLTYLWSNPDITAAGYTPYAKESIITHIGMDANEVDSILNDLKAQGEIQIDHQTREVLVTGWLDMNYLQGGSPAASPHSVLEALELIKSATLRGQLLQEIQRLDVQQDAAPN